MSPTMTPVSVDDVIAEIERMEAECEPQCEIFVVHRAWVPLLLSALKEKKERRWVPVDKALPPEGLVVYTAQISGSGRVLYRDLHCADHGEGIWYTDEYLAADRPHYWILKPELPTPPSPAGDV